MAGPQALLLLCQALFGSPPGDLFETRWWPHWRVTTGGSKEWGRGQALLGSVCGRWWHITVLVCSSVSSTQGSAPRVWGYLPAPWCLVAAVSRGRHVHALHRKASGGWEAQVRPEAGARRGSGGKDPSPQVGMLSPPPPMTSGFLPLPHFFPAPAHSQPLSSAHPRFQRAQSVLPEPWLPSGEHWPPQSHCQHHTHTISPKSHDSSTRDRDHYSQLTDAKTETQRG